jgi:NAD-dependent deacetylase
MRKKIVVFSGAGLDKASGIDTYRDIENGLWYNYNPEEVATIEGWENNPAKVLEFHNMLIGKLSTATPNEGHHSLVRLESEYDVIHITQNVTNLLEMAGASNVIHLHGQLTKARGSSYPNKENLEYHVIDVDYEPINIGDMCPVTNSQLRPNLVWFGEYPHSLLEAYEAVINADVLLIVGTSLQISYTLHMLVEVKNYNKDCQIYYIDPNPVHYLDNYGITVNYIRKDAVDGLADMVEELITKSSNDKEETE